MSQVSIGPLIFLLLIALASIPEARADLEPGDELSTSDLEAMTSMLESDGYGHTRGTNDCPSVANPDHLNSKRGALGDACPRDSADLDRDGDTDSDDLALVEYALGSTFGDERYWPSADSDGDELITVTDLEAWFDSALDHLRLPRSGTALTPEQADLNGDGFVDSGDLGQFESRRRQCTAAQEPGAIDFDSDGQLTEKDYHLLMEAVRSYHPRAPRPHAITRGAE